MRRKLAVVVFATIFLAFILSNPIYAQAPNGDSSFDIDWQELKTEKFIIVYADSINGIDASVCACGVGEAEFYAGFIDDVYAELVEVFGAELDTPINLRLFPTEDSYYEVNPIARRLTGVVAHALNTREEIAIALPRTKTLAEEDIINNTRHELTHFFASYLSDGNLTAGFQEGIAQYLEKPTDRSSYDPSLLELAYQQQRLLPWSQVDSSAEVFQDPQVAYPQTLSITSFLIDQYGFTKYIEFIEANATEPGYRSALEVTYGKSADELETEWLAYLPDYLAGRWRINAVYAYDLTRVTQLVNNGAFTDAETELAEITELLKTTNQTDVLTEAEHLLAQAQQGKTAGTLADAARQALLEGNYGMAVTKANEALVVYEGLRYRERVPEIQVYIQRAELGQGALEQLNRGEALLNTFQFFEAEREIRDATVMLQSLGNEAGEARGKALIDKVSQRQSIVGYGILAVGILLVMFNGIRRIIFRMTANPLEMEYTV